MPPAASTAATAEEGHQIAKRQPAKVLLQLALMTTRGAEPVHRLDLPRGTEIVELQIAIEGMEEFKSFDVAVQDHAAQTVWERGIEPRTLDGVPTLVAGVPADRLPSGRCGIRSGTRSRPRARGSSSRRSRSRPAGTPDPFHSAPGRPRLRGLCSGGIIMDVSNQTGSDARVGVVNNTGGRSGSRPPLPARRGEELAAPAVRGDLHHDPTPRPWLICFMVGDHQVVEEVSSASGQVRLLQAGASFRAHIA